MLERLERLTNIIVKLQDRLTTLKNEGQNTSSAETAISNAQKAIETSKIAVQTQSSKEYVPQISNESALQQTISTTSSQLKTDLATTHKTVIAAHQAVVKAHQAIIAIRRTVISPTQEITSVIIPTVAPITE